MICSCTNSRSVFNVKNKPKKEIVINFIPRGFTTMIHPAPPAKMLVGISLDQEDGTELLSWAIKNLARPNDTIIALHVLEARKKRNGQRKGEMDWNSIAKYQTQIRQAKAFVISVLGEFAKACAAKQINLEARVGFSSSVGRGLVEEAKDISAEFLLLGNSKNRLNRFSHETKRYCFEHTPEPCSLVLVGRCAKPQQDLQSGSVRLQEFRHSNPKWSTKNNVSRSKGQKPSPRTVLDLSEGESQSTEEDSSSFGDSSTTESPPLALELKVKSDLSRQMSPLKRISSFFRSPFESYGRRRRDDGLPVKEKRQPLLRCFSYDELANATNEFNPVNIVGIGGYSEVYKGDLENGHSIAVKRLAKDNTDLNKEKEFLMELGILGHVNHPNTASLVGCCVENGLYLVFNYYPNGTLSSALHGKMGKPLEWPVRYKIALGVARGLHYLHKCCKHRIIHRDIKASNVLLGPDYEPQISDFGLAKWLPSKWTHHAVIPIEGTFGYLAPEYFMHGIVDEKTDVFAFGVLLLEILSGRMPVDSSQQNLLLWAKPLMESGDIHELADPEMDGKYDNEQIHRLVLTASYCVRQSSDWRPSMTEVLELLIYGDESVIAESRRKPESIDEEEMDDYSMIFGYELPSDISLDDI